MVIPMRPETKEAIIEIWDCNLKFISFISLAFCTIVNAFKIIPNPITFTIKFNWGSAKNRLIAPAEKNRTAYRMMPTKRLK